MTAPHAAAHALLDDFLEPARRASATHALAALGEHAVPAVTALLDGTARNRWGVPLRSFAEAVRCALVTARHLGPVAAPLEPLLRAELRSEAPFLREEAASALRALGSISDDTASELARAAPQYSET
jgi:hypothetical protein